MIRTRVSMNGWLLLAALAGVSQFAAGCGSSAENRDGTGGSFTTGTGGAPATGSGGATATDAGRDAGPSCVGQPFTHVSTFGAIFDGWKVAFNSTPELVPMPGVGPDGGFSGTVMEHDPAVGSPANGSAKLSIPFSGTGQQLLFAHDYSGVNMKGTTVTAQVRLDSGLISGPTDLARAFLVLKSTTGYLYAPGPDVALDPTAGWQTLSVSADAPSAGVPAGYTSCDIREIDLVIETGSTGMYKAAVVHIDTIAISDGSTPDGGSDEPDAL